MYIRKLVFISILLCIGCTSVFAGYVIDGGLSDWGVNPSISSPDWIPNGSTIDYKQTNKQGEYTDPEHGFNYNYDFRAMYFDDTPTHFYVAIVTRYDPVDSYGDQSIGDLWIDLTGDMVIHDSSNAHGIVTGLDYALFIGSDPLGMVVRVNDFDTESADTHYQEKYGEWINGSWHDTSPGKNNYYRQGSPWLCTIDPTDPSKASQVMGMATVAIFSDDDWRNYVIEMEIPRALFGVHSEASQIGLHITQWCGNDQDTMFGTIGSNYVIVPVPGALILVSIGACIAGRFRR